MGETVPTRTVHPILGYSVNREDFAVTRSLLKISAGELGESRELHITTCYARYDRDAQSETKRRPQAGDFHLPRLKDPRVDSRRGASDL